jgi:hypothetical protein
MFNWRKWWCNFEAQICAKKKKKKIELTATNGVIMPKLVI